MDRPVITILAASGLRLSLQATRNIRHLRAQAQAGDRAAQEHFTQTPHARVLGIRNSDLGIAFYSAVGLATLTGLAHRPAVLRALRVGSAASVVMSGYLLWALLVVLRVRCPICLRAHAVNVLTFLGLLRLSARK